jgi:hypothetical protein
LIVHASALKSLDYEKASFKDLFQEPPSRTSFKDSLQRLPSERRGVGVQAGRKCFGVSAASRLRLLTRLPDLRLVFLAQLDLQGANILLNPGKRSGTRDGEEVVTLGQDPGQGQLTSSGVLLLRELSDAVDELEVLGEVLGGEAWCELAEVTLLEVVGAADLTTEHASSNGRVGYDGDAELACGLEEADLLRLDVETERRVPVKLLVSMEGINAIRTGTYSI